MGGVSLQGQWDTLSFSLVYGSNCEHFDQHILNLEEKAIALSCKKASGYRMMHFGFQLGSLSLS